MSATHNITRTVSSYCIYGNSLPTIIALIFHAVLLHNVSFGLSRQRKHTFSQYRRVSFSLRLLYFCQIKTYLQAIMLCCAWMPARCRLRIVFTIEADIFSGILQVTELGQDSNLFFYFFIFYSGDRIIFVVAGLDRRENPVLCLPLVYAYLRSEQTKRVRLPPDLVRQIPSHLGYTLH